MEKMIRVITLILVLVTLTTAHNTFTGGYSGAPGKSSCASSCHGGSIGTIQVSGFPTSYKPGQTYTITITHNGGNKIVNINATTRLGSTTTVAGSFVGGSNSILYTGDDGGVYAPTHLVDVVVFQWNAPAAGSGPVILYAAGFQGTSTGSPSGQSSKVSLTTTEVTTGIDQTLEQPREFTLLQNYPNPFNPTTNIEFTVPSNGRATLKVFNAIGQEVATLFNGEAQAGKYNAVQFNASGLATGLYFSRLEFGGAVQLKKMMLVK
ncbi:MAG: choice-of-anchor V domain-containing protein [Bacteroidota bacterium]|nr:choice-of-anchor V domain-containing protein [Bacteroidota bacterium]